MAIWLVPALMTLCFYGVGQGLVKQYIAEVPPARFCFYLIAARATLSVAYFALFHHGELLPPEGRAFAATCVVAYVCDGIGWLLYFHAIVYGPIAIVGTLSAAYPALTVLIARVFLGEALATQQYVGVALVIGGCIGLSYAPGAPGTRVIDRRWIPLSAVALLFWGCSSALLKVAYRLPAADEANAMIFSVIGGGLTLGVYGVLRGRPAAGTGREWLRAALPMLMLGAGDLGFIFATRYGPVSLTTPLTGAYPVITVIYARLVLREKIGLSQAFCIASIIFGMVLAPGPQS